MRAPVPRLSRLVLPWLAALVLVGCGGSNATSSSQPSPTPSSSPSPSLSPSPTPSTSPSPTTGAYADPCKLVTAAEASVAVGTTVTGGALAIPGACLYRSPDGKFAVLVFARVYPDASTAQNIDIQQTLATLGGSIGVSNAKPVPGIGDKAVEYTATSSQGSGTAIFVFKGNVVVMIAVTPTSDPTVVEKLATNAVGRI